MEYTQREANMWEETRPQKQSNLSDEAINAKYSKGEQRIITETNREKLPSFVESLKQSDVIETSPFYQRRKRWDRERQSKLIESFIMNVPVPPVFLYEKDFGKYEVMDGQQRIAAMQEYYNNEFELTGLKQWPELNGRRYHDLPDKVRAGIDRRSISSIILLKESAPADEDALFVRQTVFERLNTGGVKLEAQEIRNALFPGEFNKTLVECAKNDLFRNAWGLPLYTEREERGTAAIHRNSFYKKMDDIELVLRFFALRHVSHYRLGMKGFLSLYMQRSVSFDKEASGELAEIFEKTIKGVIDIYGANPFRIYNAKKGEWIKTPRKGVYDGIMVGLWKNQDKLEELKAKKDIVIQRTKDLFAESDEGTFTGRGNTKKDIETRINLFATLFQDI